MSSQLRDLFTLFGALVEGACSSFSDALDCLRPWEHADLDLDHPAMEHELRRVFAERQVGDSIEEARRVTAATVQLRPALNYGPQICTDPVKLISSISAAMELSVRACAVCGSIRMMGKLYPDLFSDLANQSPMGRLVVNLDYQMSSLAYGRTTELQAIARALPRGAWPCRKPSRQQVEGATMTSPVLGARYLEACQALGLEPWRPGMLALRHAPGMRDHGQPEVRITRSGDPEYARDSGAIPDLDDPATLGCVLAVVREAWSDLGLAAIGAYDSPGRLWTVAITGAVCDGAFCKMACTPRDSEAEALVCALEAAVVAQDAQ